MTSLNPVGDPLKLETDLTETKQSLTVSKLQCEEKGTHVKTIVLY